MKKNLLIVFIFMLISSVGVFAQQSSEIPVVTKEQKEIAKLQVKLLQDKEKLAKLHAEKPRLIAESNKKHSDAVSAASSNAKVAEELSNDAYNKSKAKQAAKAAKKASSEAKAASKAAARIDKNDKQINQLEKNIEKSEAKIQKLEARTNGN